MCSLTTVGRRTGRPHTVEIWFARDAAANPGTLYMLSGGLDRADFVRNIRADPRVTVRVGGDEYAGSARILAAGTDEDGRARRLLLAKYQRPGHNDLADWGRTALGVAVDLVPVS